MLWKRRLFVCSCLAFPLSSCLCIVFVVCLPCASDVDFSFLPPVLLFRSLLLGVQFNSARTSIVSRALPTLPSTQRNIPAAAAQSRVPVIPVEAVQPHDSVAELLRVHQLIREASLQRHSSNQRNAMRQPTAGARSVVHHVIALPANSEQCSQSHNRRRQQKQTLKLTWSPKLRSSTCGYL
jgi:hypothetical protein